MVTKFKDDFTPESITLSGKNAPPQPLRAHIEGETIVDGTKFPPQNETKLTEIVLEFECTDALFEYVRKYTYGINSYPKKEDLIFEIEFRTQEAVLDIYSAWFGEVDFGDLETAKQHPAVVTLEYDGFTIEDK